MLNDLLGEQARRLRREVALVVAEVEEGVPAARKSASDVRGIDRQQLANRLSTDRGLADEAARWAVDRWATALGVTPEVPIDGRHHIDKEPDRDNEGTRPTPEASSGDSATLEQIEPGSGGTPSDKTAVPPRPRRILIRALNVEENEFGRFGSYFFEGAKTTGIVLVMIATVAALALATFTRSPRLRAGLALGVLFTFAVDDTISMWVDHLIEGAHPSGLHAGGASSAFSCQSVSKSFVHAS